MLKCRYLLCILVVAGLAGSFGCTKTSSSASYTVIDDGVEKMLQNKWTYFYWSSCPQSPLSASPCYTYTQADTAYFGTGTVALTIDAAKQEIRWSTEGYFQHLPHSYIYSHVASTMTYKPVNNYVFLLVDKAGGIVDTVKIQALTDHLLVLKYTAGAFGNVSQVDSLRR